MFVLNIFLTLSDMYTAVKNFFFALIELLQPLFPKDVLLFIDKIDKNTELIDAYSLFQKAIENNLKAYYIILKTHPDYKKIKQKYPKNTITYCKSMHILHFFKFLRLSKFMTSFGVTDSLKFFLFKNKYIDFIFLDHGVILLKDNIFCNYNKHTFNKFLVSNDYEAQIVKEKGGFKDTDLIKVTLPRFDLLKSNTSEKNIFFFFTWRLSFGSYNYENGLYYKNLISLLNNPKLFDLLQKNNVKISIAMHHCLLEKHFTLPISKNIHFIDSTQISKQIKEASMLVTDYSSIWSDFYFQNKPVVFYRLDEKDTNLIKQDKYDMKFATQSNHLLANITENEDEVIDMIEKYINKNFKVDDEYKALQDKFFYQKENIRDSILEQVGAL